MATATLLAGLLPASAAIAGGPLIVANTGAPYVWSTAAAIPYRTDNGPLSASVTEAQAQARVLAMFNVWENVTTSNIDYNRAGFISDTGAFTDGDVSTAVEFDAVEADCGTAAQSPIIYDVDATIFIDLGLDETAIIGFAGPCTISSGAPFQIGSGHAVMNGLFQDGQALPVADIPAAAYDAAFIHEFGHFSGLDHSQINVNCLGFCGADDLEGVPTMFPFLIDVSQGVLSDDDEAWISRLYPQTAGGTTFANTHGTITGTVFFSDGLSHAQFVNVIARRVDAGANEDRRSAVSVSSGFRALVFRGNPINDPTGAGLESAAAGDIGRFEIPVPTGSYIVEVEAVDPGFTGGSSIGGWPYDTRIGMPGTAPAPTAPIVVAAGATVSGVNVTLIGTDPRYDQFEGP